MKKTSNFENGLIWFGAGVSIAEIITGTYFAPLGFKNGLMAILIGHLIGAVLLYLAGIIGGMSEKSAMETVKMSFGQKGGLFFAFLNVLQLVGWTAIMIYDGAISTSHVFTTGHILWALVIGLLILVWIKIGISNLGKLNTVSMSLLFILTIVLSFKILKGVDFMSEATADAMSFGLAIELAIAMPMSWMPLISDYTREAEEPKAATLTSTLTYSLVSIWMYVIGMGMALLTEESDIAMIMVKSGLGLAAMLIIILSTVTTTFLDAYSAGISAESLSKKVNGQKIGIIVTIIGTIGAIIFPMDDITDFLYLIGSVFAPMIAVQIADYFILKKDVTGCDIYVKNMIIWLIGFIIYRILLKMDIFIGSTIACIVIVLILKVIVEKLIKD
ncbi:putative hydroxymethylpyrimidine transporter CytX [Anaerococcus sp. NML200574]|uniref:putative hydroxymethylpyrimidine transporter CytX n=1 Tax=Anaerococcus sp. NML200574 TaxID=2954486 RepID=UPI002237E6D5|nr:putative hydroxymethylpyrimidine transporter CytX [Anaerococcus sp. NML200574]MCW6677655.1 putative hydroxymethylpyrimidine transporter CytX [Anaerococcus sp. NML200574]